MENVSYQGILGTILGVALDSYNIELIPKDGKVTNNLYPTKEQFSLIIKELKRGINDFKKGKLSKRNEMKRTNDFVWLGYEKNAKGRDMSYLALYFNDGKCNVVINFDLKDLKEVEQLYKELKAAYDVW